MSEPKSVEIGKVRTALEELWTALDSLFGEMSPADWGCPHGPDWTFADLPYHLAYIDRLLVARPIELGRDLPAAEQASLGSLSQLNAWNQARFAARPKDQTVEKSIEQMHSSRDAIRRITAEMTDTDLARPAWFPALHLRGFRSAEVALNFCIGHTWQHMEEARIHRGHAGTMVGPALTHALLKGDALHIPVYLKVPTTTLFLDARKAEELDISFSLEITGAGGGTWAFHSTGDGWQVAEANSAGTDLVLTMALDTYVRFRYFIRDLVSLVESGEIVVNDEQAFSLYRQLFVPPDLDFVFPQLP